MPKLDLAKKQFADLRTKMEIGLANQLDLAQAEVRVFELEVEAKKADLDLSVIRRQIDQRRGK